MSRSRSSSPGPHDNMRPYIWNGPVTADTKCVVIFLHGRGSCPKDDLPVYEPTFRAVAGPDASRVVAIGLEAQDENWFPGRWDQAIASQEPYLSSALHVLHSTLLGLPVPPARVVLLGFSQGAALSITYALKNPVRLGGVVALSGTIIGKPEDWVTRKGSLGATPVYLAWGDRDTYYAVERTERDVKSLQERGAEVRLEIFPGMGHFVTAKELERLEDVLRHVVDKDDQAPAPHAEAV